MSLKTFHIIFIVASILLLLGFGIWAVREYMRTDSIGMLIMGVASLCGFVGLLFYGRYFLKKSKHINYL